MLKTKGGSAKFAPVNSKPWVLEFSQFSSELIPSDSSPFLTLLVAFHPTPCSDRCLQGQSCCLPWCQMKPKAQLFSPPADDRAPW